MEEEMEAQEAEQPPATEGNEAREDSPEDEEETVIGSFILEADGPTTRKIQTEFTLPCKGPKVAAMVAAAKDGAVMPSPPVFQPCGDMPLPPGADPGQWGFPEFCPRKMLRYAEAAAAAAATAEASPSETALPGEAVDTLFDEEREEPAGDKEPVAEEQPDDAQPVTLSVLSQDAGVAVLGEESQDVGVAVVGEESQDVGVVPLSEEVVIDLQTSSSDVFMDAIGMEEHEEWWSDEDIAGSSDTLGGVTVEIEVEVPPAGIADTGSVGFQAQAAADEGGRPQEEDATEKEQQQHIEVEVQSAGIADAGSVGFQAPAAADEGGRPKEEESTEQEPQPPEEGAGVALQPHYPPQMDTPESMGPVLWKIEQDIAVVRSKLNEMQQKITALDISDLSGGSKPVLRRKCVCDPQKKAADMGLPAGRGLSADRGLPAPPVTATGAPPPGTNMLPGAGGKQVYHSAPCLRQQYSQRHSFTNVAHDFKLFPQQFPQMGGGVDIYIASRSGHTSAVTSINPASLQQYAEKPVLKAFGSPDVDVYVVTDVAAPGYSRQN